jgi:aspartate/methionine/tyrosine aminotransferase
LLTVESDRFCLFEGRAEEIAAFAEKHDLIVLADEIYAELTYDEEFTSFAALPE